METYKRTAREEWNKFDAEYDKLIEVCTRQHRLTGHIKGSDTARINYLGKIHNLALREANLERDMKLKILSTVLTIITAMLMFSSNSTVVKDISAYVLGAIIILIYLKSSAPSFMVVFNVFSDLIAISGSLSS